jgi:hypothetical protein
VSDAINPFSSRYVRPGAIPFLFPPGQSVEILLGRLERSDWRGEIVGPHGSGKSTLLAALADAIARSGRSTLLLELHQCQRRLDDERLRRAVEGQVVMVDGYEQLGLLARWRLRRGCRERRLGLVVTSHRRTGLPSLYRTSTDVALARRVVDYLLEAQRQTIEAHEIAAAMAQRRGDLREVLFDLYDLYEARRGEQGFAGCS